jgi:predicted GIY-YIG superfamily endonuclease
MAKTTTIYLLHFHQHYHHAGHYLGSTSDLEVRIAEHRAGHGARLIEVIAQAGIEWEVVRTWKGGRKREREIKNRKHSNHLCPRCSGDAALRRCK